MTTAGGSAERWAKELRDGARRGVWRRVASWLGITAHTRRADAKAANCEAGAKGEQMTADLLAEAGLVRAGWKVLHDRRIPGCDLANADHILVSPGGRLYIVDSKLWSKYTGPVHPRAGRLWHGEQGRDKVIESLGFEAMMVERALRTPVTALMVVHSAPVWGDGFSVRGVSVMPARRLVELLVFNDGPANPGALWLANAVEAKLPPYRQ